MSHVLVRQQFTDVLPIGKRDAIRDALVNESSRKPTAGDAGLLSGRRPTRRHSTASRFTVAGAAAHGGEVGTSRSTVQMVEKCRLVVRRWARFS